MCDSPPRAKCGSANGLSNKFWAATGCDAPFCMLGISVLSSGSQCL